MKPILKLAATLLIAALASGCATSTFTPEQALQRNMQWEDKAAAVPSGKARIVVLRPSMLGWPVAAPVWRVADDGKSQELMGIASYGASFDYFAEPGKHTFFVTSETADFMQADVVAGKTYYIVATPRMGVWKARFSLRPIQKDPGMPFNFGQAESQKWIKEARPIAMKDSAKAWATEHQAEIDKLRDEVYPAWQKKSTEEKAQLTMKPEDGV